MSKPNIMPDITILPPPIILEPPFPIGQNPLPTVTPVEKLES